MSAGDFAKMADFLKSKAPNAVIFDTTAAEPVIAYIYI